MIGYEACPLCFSSSIHKALTAKDHTVSGESFEIWHCDKCTGRFTQNIPDQQSMDRYYQSGDYISHSDTTKGLVNQLYHAVRKRTLSSKRKLVQGYTGLKRGTVLDIGSGTGAFLKEMKLEGWEISGVEPDRGARNKAIELYQLRIDTPEHLHHYPENSFDALTLWHVLEHVHDLHNKLQQFRNLIRNKGKLFIAVPNYTSYDAEVYGKNWAAYDVPRHLYHFSPEAMQKLLNDHKLQLHAVKPMWFDSFYISMLSEKYITGRSKLGRAFWRGFVSDVKTLWHKNHCSSLLYVAGKNE